TLRVERGQRGRSCRVPRGTVRLRRDRPDGCRLCGARAARRSGVTRGRARHRCLGEAPRELASHAGGDCRVNAGQVLIDVGAVIITLLAVVLVHECGHFSVAKLAHIRVDEFAVGFGPKVFWRRRGETLYSLRAIPAGGFVRMPGMLGLEGEPDAGDRNFYRASKPRRFSTLAAGIVFNFVFAGLCFTAVNMAPTPSRVLAGGPLATAGVGDGATIIAIDGVAVRHDTPPDVTTDLHAATARSQGRPL